MHPGRTATAAVALCALFAPSTISAEPGPAGCGTGSWIAGTVDLCGGRLVYRDYVYDDYGAQGLAQPPSTGSLSNPTGTQSYPAPSNTVNNYADIAEIRVLVGGAQVLVSFELNSLFAEGSTAVALAIDVDDDPATGGGQWSDLIAFPDAPGSPLPLTSTGFEIVKVFEAGSPDTVIDTDTNRITGIIHGWELPLGALSASHWRLQAVAAVASTRTVMNVGFRGTNETGTWFEDQQAAALQSGDISQFGYTVELAKLTGGVTERANPGPGYYERVYTSDHTIAVDGGRIVYDTGAEGVNYDGIPGRGTSGAAGAFAQEFHFVGRNQPYGIFVPSAPAPHGLQLALHGYSANHTSLVDSVNPLHEGLQQNVGVALNRILVVPLGRGPAGFYSDISERDVLDVMADVEANYPVDRERVFSGGYSMGGYGTLRMATTYPDRFAGYIDWVGYPGDACGQPDLERCEAGEVGMPAEWLMNLREVDGALLYSGADELVNSAQGLWLRGLLAAVGLPHIFYYHPAADHFTYALLDDWMKEAAYTAGLVRRTRPPRVTYRTAPYGDSPELGIRHDRAYWVSEIVSRFANPGERDYADVDIKSYGCGGAERAFTSDAPGAGTDPVPWESQSISVSGSVPIVQQNRIEATLANVTSVAVDGSIGGACIRPDEPLAYHVVTDGPTAIAISDYRVLEFDTAGTYDGIDLPEPGAMAGLVGGAALLAMLARRSRARA
jgi:pimeloyl-ACP methyl ester carboxylesterase